MPQVVKFKEPVASRVYQRDANGKAEIPIVLDDKLQDAELIDARISGVNMATQGIKLVDGKLVGVPVGGPYTITCSVKAGRATATMTRPSVPSSWATSGCWPASRTWRGSAT